MAAPFVQTLRALAAERRGGVAVALGVAFVLVSVWLYWGLCASVTVYEASQEARVESEGLAHPIHAPLGARIVGLQLSLGQSVHAGEVLVELDAELQKHGLIEERTRLAELAPEIEALRRVLGAREQSLEDDRQATLSALDQGHARQRQAEIAAALLEEELSRASRLHANGTIPEMELLRVRADAHGHAAESEAAALDVIRQRREQRTRQSRGTSDLEALRRELVTLEGRQATSTARIDRLSAEIDRRTVRAAVTGSVESIAPFTVGAYVNEGDPLGTIVPAGELRVIAEFTPATAVGRVHPGQVARVRLDGYPWTEYGELDAQVRRVASEVRHGQVRVELALSPEGNLRVPLRHGMTASVQVELERTTPAALVLRAVGKALQGKPAATATLAATAAEP